MYPIKEFEKRFRGLLDEMDELRADADDEDLEDLEELAADFEDALFVVECIGADDEDWREQFTDALDEFSDIAEGSRRLAREIPQMEGIAERTEALIQMARANLPE